MDDQTINYIKKVPVWKTVAGLIIACFTIFEFVTGNYYALVIISFSVLLLQTEGCQINLKTKTYRNTYSILGLNFGAWEPLPNPEYVTVFATDQITEVWVSTASTTVTEDVYEINIFGENNKKIKASVSYDKKEAFNIALLFADNLKINMLDATVSQDFKWIDVNHYKTTGTIIYMD